MVAWNTCCRPTELGGLGVSDLRLSGYALQTRWLWLQRTDQERAWSQLPIRTCPQVQAFFKASTFVVIGNGERTLFWEDRWLQGEGVADIAPCVYLLVPPRTRQRQTVRGGLHERSWANCLQGGMSMQAILDYLHLWRVVSNVQLTSDPDRTVWRWSEDGTYSARSAYMKLHIGSAPFTSHRLIWKTWAPLKIKIFLWLAFRRRHWTADRRRRHGLEAHDNCHLCD